MLARVKTFFERLDAAAVEDVATSWSEGGHALVGGGRRETDAGANGGTVTRSPHLFKCPSCEQVYVATEKRTCSTCDVAVDRVAKPEEAS